MKKTYEKIVNKLKEFLDAEPEKPVLTDDQELFLEKRSRIEVREDLYTIEGYVQHYERLEAKLMRNLNFLIEWYFKNPREEFLASEFYEWFGEHEVVGSIIKNKTI